MKINGPGRLGGSLPQGSHRSGLAQLRHPARHVMYRYGTAHRVDRDRGRKRGTLQEAMRRSQVIRPPRRRRDSQRFQTQVAALRNRPSAIELPVIP